MARPERTWQDSQSLHADAPGALPYVLTDRAIALSGAARTTLEGTCTRLAEATGLPVGIKSAVGELGFWQELAAAMRDNGLPGRVHGVASMVAMIFNDAPFSDYRSMPLRRREADMVYALHRYLLNHGVTIIPHGLMLLSTAMTDDDIDETLLHMRNGMKELAETFGA